MKKRKGRTMTNKAFPSLINEQMYLKLCGELVRFYRVIDFDINVAADESICHETKCNRQ